MATVFIPLPLRKYTAGQQQVVVEGKTLRELVDNLEANFIGRKEKIVRDGRLRPGLSAVVDGRPTRRGLLQPIGEDSEIHFLPSIAGG